MKLTLVLLFWCLLQASASAQTFRVDTLPTEGVLLDKGWRWHLDDNAVWATTAFDDRRWDTIPVYPTLTQLPGIRQKNIGWFRLAVQLDSGVARQAMSLRVFQRWASDLYVDGQLVHQFGQIDQSGRVVASHLTQQGEYILLPPLAAGRHRLAIRLARQPNPWYAPGRLDRVGSVLSIRLVPTADLPLSASKRAYWDALESYGLMGFFLTLAIIHLFYYAYRRKRINLIFSLTMFFGACSFVVSNLFDRTPDPVQAEWFAMLNTLVIGLYLTALLLTYYRYLHQRPHWLFWVTAVVMVGNAFAASYLPYDLTDYIIPWSIAMLLTLGMTLSIKAIKRKAVDGWIVLGSLVTLIVVLTTQLILNTVFRDSLATYATVINQGFDSLFFLTVPFTLALLLARDNAYTNAQLTQNLAEVKRLSDEKEAILTQQKAFLEEQVAVRTTELSQSLAELRATQDQLVQREKMASLGELTAGIAHEIQNPLNFVNNFTEVSTELVEEIQEERGKPANQRNEGLEVELLGDLTQNLGKIGFHGKRASNIVRGMLEHSRTSTGTRELTNLNGLIDEYLRLSYHGLRRSGDPAKEKTFNAKIITDFAPNLSLVSVVSQDIGRVLLNLFNNAFYAVHQRAILASATYEPTVSVSTTTVDGGIEIRVSDNGTGIPAGVLNKIFQPFFTTKPTGEGTGLGLSLSYDIITKGHGGTMRVESVEGEGSTFVIGLPAS